MKKLTTMLICLLTACTAFSQKDSKGKDTCICVTPTEMKNAIWASDSLQIIKAVVLSQDSLIMAMDDGLKKSTTIIKRQDDLHLNDIRIKANLDNQIASLTKSNLLSLDMNSYLKKQWRLQKKKTVVISGISLSIISGLVYLLVK